MTDTDLDPLDMWSCMLIAGIIFWMWICGGIAAVALWITHLP